MPAVPPEELVLAITSAITESGYVGQIVSRLRRNPRRFVITEQNEPLALTTYAWTLTFGGRPDLQNEYRIQMTGVVSPLELGTDGPTILIGYEPELRLFAGFDLRLHRTFTTGSPSVQIDHEELRKAESEGLSFHRKSNDEIAVGIRPDLFMAYATNAQMLHLHGRDANVFRLLKRAVHEPPPQQEVATLSTKRQRIISEVSRLSRTADFRQRVLFAYGNRCAVTRVQLRLVEAAHILPVGAPGSSDHVNNGIALAPTYHRAFDAGLIYLG
jgi:putative restriction endonuclease